MTKSCQHSDDQPDHPTPARKKPYAFTEADRAQSLEIRRYIRDHAALLCDNCTVQWQCKKFKPNSVCGLNPEFKGLPSRNVKECIAQIQEMARILEERVRRGLYFEQLKGGKATWRVSRLLTKTLKTYILLLKLYREK